MIKGCTAPPLTVAYDNETLDCSCCNTTCAVVAAAGDGSQSEMVWVQLYEYNMTLTSTGELYKEDEGAEANKGQEGFERRPGPKKIA